MSLHERFIIKNLGVGGGENELSKGDLKFSAVLSWCLISNNKGISNMSEKRYSFASHLTFFVDNIHPLKVYNSVVFSIYTKFCNYHY